MNEYLHSFLSNVEVYINNQQLYISIGHKSYLWNNFKRAISDSERVLYCETCGHEEFHNEFLKAPLSKPIFDMRLKILKRPDGFMLYGKTGVDLFSTSDMLYPNIEMELHLIRGRPIFQKNTDELNFSLRFIDCSLYTRRNSLNDE